jgi:hypothetical protein
MKSNKTFKVSLNTPKKKLKKTKKRKNRKHLSKMRKYNIKGGFGEILGQGSHGIITVDPTDENKVIKSFISGSGNKIKFCEKLQNEYNVQTFLNSEFKRESLCVTVPFADQYMNDEHICSYRMDRIMPLKGYNYYLIPNLTQLNYERPFIHSNLGVEVGIVQLTEKYRINLPNVIRCIAEMFSYLHYVLEYDGYDCEILIGGNSELYLIDYDKIQKIEFNLDYISYRKLDESTVEEKKLRTVQRFAWFLYSAMGSMSLIPAYQELKNPFIEGYSKYASRNNELAQEICRGVIEEITEFSI